MKYLLLIAVLLTACIKETKDLAPTASARQVVITAIAIDTPLGNQGGDYGLKLYNEGALVYSDMHLGNPNPMTQPYVTTTADNLRIVFFYTNLNNNIVDPCDTLGFSIGTIEAGQTVTASSTSGLRTAFINFTNVE